MRIIKKIKYRFSQPPKLPLENERILAELPSGGASISIEMALNSRCTSDYDNDPKHFHWGMFDPQEKLSSEQINRIINLVKIPRFTDRQLRIQAEKNWLTFFTELCSSKIDNEWGMVESGMQQQAVGLICAALGIGMVFKSLGKDGVSISTKEHAAIKIKMAPMKASYNGSYWTDLPPQGKKAWVKGNLPDPERNGNKSLIAAFDELKLKNLSGKQATDENIGQLLWAARGRTPHYYKSRPWGMTIPTDRGRQDFTTIFYISGKEITEYINWKRNRPSHSTIKIDEIKTNNIKNLNLLPPGFNRAILIAINENCGSALWEVGYQLLNVFLQAYSLNIRYSGILVDGRSRTSFESIGLKSPVAVVCI